MSDSLPLGESAALGAALLWSFSSLMLTFAARRIGSLTVNRWRLLFATVLLALVHTFVTGSPIPDASGNAWMWLALSGIIGLALGDTFLFRTFVILGPRLGMVLMTLSPVFTTLLALLLLGERLTPLQHAGIVLVIAGVSWAVIHRPPQADRTEGESAVKGVIYGVLASLGQAVGLVFARMGMDAGVMPLTANLMRMSSAFVLMTLIVVLRGRIKAVASAYRDGVAMRYLLGASALGPVTGVWLSLVAVKLAPMGIAATLMGTSPVLLIPLSHFLLKERIHPQSVVGTGVAVLGVALLLGISG